MRLVLQVERNIHLCHHRTPFEKAGRVMPPLTGVHGAKRNTSAQSGAGNLLRVIEACSCIRSESPQIKWLPSSGGSHDCDSWGCCKDFIKNIQNHVVHGGADCYDVCHLSFYEQLWDFCILLWCSDMLLRWIIGETLVSFKLNAHIDPTQVTTFSSVFAHPLQSAFASHAKHYLRSHSVKKHVCFAPRWWS